jgi:hypothetical protein
VLEGRTKVVGAGGKSLEKSVEWWEVECAREKIGESKREVVCGLVDDGLVEGGEKCMDLVVEGRVKVGKTKR